MTARMQEHRMEHWIKERWSNLIFGSQCGKPIAWEIAQTTLVLSVCIQELEKLAMATVCSSGAITDLTWVKSREWSRTEITLKGACASDQDMFSSLLSLQEDVCYWQTIGINWKLPGPYPSPLPSLLLLHTCTCQEACNGTSWFWCIISFHVPVWVGLLLE